MLLWLAQFFQQDLGPLRIFNFITFRAVFATITAVVIGLGAGPAVIRLADPHEGGPGGAHLRSRKPIWQSTARRPWAAC